MHRQSKYWCFTQFGENEPVFNAEHMNYMIFGVEICPETGRQHFQGYVEFKNRKRTATVKDFMEAHTHLEARKGSAQEARDYCKKEGHWKEFGQTTFIQPDVKGVPYMEYVRHASGYERYWRRQLMLELKDQPKTVIYIYGITGLGKSRIATTMFGAITPVEYEQPFFNGYDGEATVLFDDIRASTIPYRTLLRITDRHPYVCNVKGDRCPWLAKTIVFTSIISPNDLFNIGSKSEDTTQFLRRITIIIELTEKEQIIHKGELELNNLINETI